MPAPTPQPNGMHHTHQHQKNTGFRLLWPGHPEGEADQAGQKCHLVKGLHRGGWAQIITLFDQPVAGKGRDDPPADHPDHHHRRRQPQPQTIALRRIVIRQRLKMEDQIGQGEHGQHGQHDEVAPVFARHNLTQDQGTKDQRKGQIDAGGQPMRQMGRKQDSNPPCPP